MLASARELWAQGSHLLAVASGCEYIASAVAAGQLSGPQKHEADNTMEYWLRCLREDPFLTLSLSPDADETEFKKSYRRLALAYHPDKNPHTTTLFQVIQACYDTLCDPRKLGTARMKARTASLRAHRHKPSSSSSRRSVDVSPSAPPSARTPSPSTSPGPGFHSKQRTSGGGKRPQTAGRPSPVRPSPPPPPAPSAKSAAHTNESIWEQCKEAWRQECRSQQAVGREGPSLPSFFLSFLRGRFPGSDADRRSFYNHVWKNVFGGAWPEAEEGAAGGKAGAGDWRTSFPPDKPHAPTVTTVTDATVTLQWTARGPRLWFGVATGHQLQWRRMSETSGSWGGWQESPAVLSSNACTKKNLVKGTSYQFRVRGVNGAGPGEWSDPVLARTLKETPPVKLSPEELLEKQAAAQAELAARVESFRVKVSASVDSEVEKARERLQQRRAMPPRPPSDRAIAKDDNAASRDKENTVAAATGGHASYVVHEVTISSDTSTNEGSGSSRSESRASSQSSGSSRARRGVERRSTVRTVTKDGRGNDSDSGVVIGSVQAERVRSDSRTIEGTDQPPNVPRSTVPPPPLPRPFHSPMTRPPPPIPSSRLPTPTPSVPIRSVSMEISDDSEGYEEEEEEEEEEDQAVPPTPPPSSSLHPHTTAAPSPEAAAAFLNYNRAYDSVKAAVVPRDAWFEIRDPASGRMYYLNTVTGESQWQLPIWILDPGSGTTSESVRYRNSVTGEVTDIRPPDYLPVVLEVDTPAIHKQEPLVSLMSPSLPASPLSR